MSANVRQCIYVMLPSGLCSAGSVAARLGVDRRTVHRHLAREGQTFSAVMDAVRANEIDTLGTWCGGFSAEAHPIAASFASLRVNARDRGFWQKRAGLAITSV
jgi:hypothetical protein